VTKLEEFKSQLVEVDREIAEKQEFREYLLKRMNEEIVKENNQTLTLNNNVLHKLLCLLDSTIFDDESVLKGSKGRENLLEFRDEISWTIAEILGYDLNEGTIDPKTFEFYTFKSRR
jgi:cobalamin biosynthesis protein CbiG